MNIPEPTRAMLDAIAPEKRQEWMLWLNQITAAIKAIDARVTTLETK